jgi:hypothetical protein
MKFMTENIYRVDPTDRTAQGRPGSVDFVDARITSEQLHWPFWVSDISRHDFAVFGSAMDDFGVFQGGFMVVRSAQNQGLLVTEEEVLRNPRYQTSELAKKFATLVGDEEIAQFGLGRVAEALREKYPGMEGFVR